MRQKTNYATLPDAVEIKSGNAGESIIFFRQNIEEIVGEDGSTSYSADEYKLIAPTTANFPERVHSNPAAWLERAKSEDFNFAAKSVRAERDRLLDESDWTQVTDSPLSPGKMADWSVYRQTLRDIPKQPGFPRAVVWPEKPATAKVED